jgi:hypothetical protein
VSKLKKKVQLFESNIKYVEKKLENINTTTFGRGNGRKDWFYLKSDKTLRLSCNDEGNKYVAHKRT